MTLNVAAIILNAVLAALAVFASVWSSRHTFPEIRPLAAARALIALLYCVAYTWLAFNVERAADWSAVLRPISLIAWPVVWIYPPVAGGRLWNRLQRQVKTIVEADE